MRGRGIRRTDDGAIWVNINSRGWKRRAHDRDIYDSAEQHFWTRRQFPERQAPMTTITLHEPKVSSRGNTVIAWRGTDQWHTTSQDDLR